MSALCPGQHEEPYVYFSDLALSCVRAVHISEWIASAVPTFCPAEFDTYTEAGT